MKTSTGSTLVRALGIFTATLLVAGIMIGSGVFKKIIPMAQTGLNETWILLAWVLAGVITMFGALNLAGLSSLTEESGGVYEYLRLSFGNFFSFLYGWTDFTIIGSASIAALAFIFSQTINTLIPLPNPLQHWQDLSIGHFIYPFADSGIKILSIITILILTWVNYRGVKESGYLNNIFTSAKIAGIFVVIILGLLYTPPAVQQAGIINITENHLQNGAFFSAFFVMMLNVLWAYDGWLDIASITGEIKNPKRNVPLAIFIGVAIATGLYVLVNYAYMHVLPLSKLATVSENEIGAAVVAETILGNAGKTMIIVLIMISVFGSLNAIILSHTRIYFRMAQENYFFKKVARVHASHRTPYMSLLYTMIWSCILVVSGTFEILTDMIVFATFLFYGLLAAALIKMKRSGAITVKVTGYPIIQIIIMLFSVVLIINTVISQPKQSLTGLGLVLIGVPFYFYFRKKDTSIQKYK
ncbi:MAG: amino acid permease [Bacteroidota bacterium]